MRHGIDKENVIVCPKCGARINVSEVLYHQLNDQIRKEFEAEQSEREKEFQNRVKEVEESRRAVEREREGLNEAVQKGVREKLIAEKCQLEKAIRENVESEKSEELKALREELGRKSDQVKELNKSKAEIEKLKREKDELRDQIALEKEKELTERLKDERSKIKKQAEEEHHLKIKEKEKLIDDLREQLADAKRKAEQGSVQLQGEIQEIEIEKILRTLYPVDEIREIRKGQRGADVVQTVRTGQGSECGKIYYESKRTKDFQVSWLQKLRDDNLTVKADVLVLVTEAMPDGVDRFILRDGVWICSFAELKGLSLVLRQGLLQVYDIMVAQHDRGTKMELLYNFLTSQEFRGQFEAIIEGFRALQNSYLDERLKMQRIWKEREKQLEKVLTNAVSFYGSLKGIAGASIPHIRMLEGDSEGTSD